jgi:cytochrome c-type biogenesis protein CcmH/NrfG
MADGAEQTESVKRAVWRWRVVLLVAVAIIAVVSLYLIARFTRDDPVTYADPEEHFKYAQPAESVNRVFPIGSGRSCRKYFLITCLGKNT